MNNPYPDVQPRYAAYCVQHQMNPDQMLDHDSERWPGGCMTGFILWISSKLVAFRKSHPELMLGDRIIDQDAFTEFLFAEAQR